MGIEDLLFDISEVLRVPVLVLTVAALALVLVEAGGLLAELARRRHRSMPGLETAIGSARAAFAAGEPDGSRRALLGVARSRSMQEALTDVVSQLGRPDAEGAISKRLAEFDYACVCRLERTRILVRFGPALGLMGTLIPLSPALAGLAEGDVVTLTENLRVAFSVTVAGLLVGAIAFGISLVRDRLYGQDFSDAEYIATSLLEGIGVNPALTVPPQQPPTPAVAHP